MLSASLLMIVLALLVLVGRHAAADAPNPNVNAVLSLDKVENSAFVLAIPEATGANFAATTLVTLPSSDFLIFSSSFGQQVSPSNGGSSGGSGTPPTSTPFDLHRDNNYSEGITYANDRFYVVDSKVYAYTSSGQSGSGGGGGGVGSHGACRAGLVVNPNESCTYKGHTFSVSSSGTGSISFFSAGTGLDIRGATINGVRWNFYATKNSDSNSWTIHNAE